MNIYKKLLLFISIYLLSTQGLQAKLQERWKISQTELGISYLPKEINGDSVFISIAFLPKSINQKDKKELLLKALKKQEKLFGKPINGWKIKEEKDGEWSSSGSINYKGKKLLLALKIERLHNGDSFIFQTVSDLQQLLKFANDYNKLVDDAKNRFNKVAPDSNTLEKESKKYSAKDIQKAIRTLPNKGVKLSEIQEVLVDSSIDVIWGGISVDTYILFKDKTLYKYCEIPPNELNIKVSKELEPKRWTTWKKSNSGYEIFNEKEKIWKKLKGKRAIKAESGEKLDGKFLTAGGSQMRGSWKYTITFKKNGRFEMSSFSMMDNEAMGGGDTVPLTTGIYKSDKTGSSGTVAISGTYVGGGGKSIKRDGDKNRGEYYLDGYTIVLKHDNGYKHTKLFFFDNPDKRSFIYGNDQYWIDD